LSKNLCPTSSLAALFPDAHMALERQI